MEGSLELQKSSFLKTTWKERYCKLQSDVLELFKEKDDADPDTTIPLFHAIVEEIKLKGQFCTFQITTQTEDKGKTKKNKTFVFSAPNEATMKKWISTLESEIARIVKSKFWLVLFSNFPLLLVFGKTKNFKETKEVPEDTSENNGSYDINYLKSLN